MLERLEKMIRRVVREEIERALVRDITVEVHREDPGNPKIETKRMSVLDYMLVCSNRTEGALRGMQSDVGRTYNFLGAWGGQIEGAFRAIKRQLSLHEEQQRLPGEPPPQ